MDRTGSMISSIFSSYEDALHFSQERYQRLYTERANNAALFYDDFLQNLIVSFDGFRDGGLRRMVRRSIQSFFETDEIQFVAIDGTCSSDAFNDFMVFSSIAYGVRGQMTLTGDPPTLHYSRRPMDEDVSMVAYVPIPFAEIPDVERQDELEDFVSRGREPSSLAHIHTILMQLAEIYLAYEMARSNAANRARVLLLDNSLSSILASTDVGVKRIGLAADLDPSSIGLLGRSIGRNHLTVGDAVVAYAHPFSDGLGLPSTKRFRMYNAIIKEAGNRPDREISVGEFATKYGLTADEVVSHFDRNGPVIDRLGHFDRTKMTFKPSFNYDESWWTSKRFFEDTCRRLFRNKEIDSLIYEVPEGNDGSVRKRWMSPEDVQFLIAVGMRALIEECWRNRVLLLGIAKDSQSRYFTRNYYGLMRHIGVYGPVEVHPLPWTDRITLEDIAVQRYDIGVPWATVEFDSCFMTLHLGQNEGETCPRPMGVKGDVVNQERLFARSLGQFYFRQRSDKSLPLMGHVVFIDRLLHPYWDTDHCKGGPCISSKDLGTVRPFFRADASAPNIGQSITMYFLDTLTRNLYPEAIGYPDPLHKADWGSKTVGRRVRRVISDSEISFRANPLARAFRTIRDERRR